MLRPQRKGIVAQAGSTGEFRQTTDVGCFVCFSYRVLRMKKIFSLALAAVISVASGSAFAFDKNIVDTAVEAGKFKNK